MKGRNVRGGKEYVLNRKPEEGEHSAFGTGRTSLKQHFQTAPPKQRLKSSLRKIIEEAEKYRLGKLTQHSALSMQHTSHNTLDGQHHQNEIPRNEKK